VSKKGVFCFSSTIKLKKCELNLDSLARMINFFASQYFMSLHFPSRKSVGRSKCEKRFHSRIPRIVSQIISSEFFPRSGHYSQCGGGQKKLDGCCLDHRLGTSSNLFNDRRDDFGPSSFPGTRPLLCVYQSGWVIAPHWKSLKSVNFCFVSCLVRSYFCKKFCGSKS